MKDEKWKQTLIAAMSPKIQEENKIRDISKLQKSSLFVAFLFAKLGHILQRSTTKVHQAHVFHVWKQPTRELWPQECSESEWVRNESEHDSDPSQLFK